MTDTILIVGTRAIAKHLGIGRNHLLQWLADPAVKFPAVKMTPGGSWVSTRENLLNWSNAFFQNRKAP